MPKLNTAVVGLKRMVDANIMKQDLLNKVDRLTKDIVQCQNSMEAGRPCSGFHDSHMDWLSSLQSDLAEAEAQLSKLEVER
jgi:hypothetical protein